MRKKHVFLSYCHADTADVKALRDDLIAAGELCWWDRDILPGQDWKLAIRVAMKDAYAVVVCLSEECEKRTRSGIYPEILDAITVYRDYKPGSMYIFLVRLSVCEIPSIEIDGTRTLERLQYIDIFPAATRADAVQRLIEALRKAPDHP